MLKYYYQWQQILNWIRFFYSTTWNSPRRGWWLHPWPFGQGRQWPQCTTFRRFEELRLRRLWQHRRFSQLPSLGKRGKRTGLRLPQRMGTTLPETGRHLWSRRQRRRLSRKKEYYLSPIHTSQKSGGRLKLKPKKFYSKFFFPHHIKWFARTHVKLFSTTT